MRDDVECRTCGKTINRETWNYGKKRVITDFFCDNKCKGDYQKTFKPVTKEWLFEHYVTKKMDTSQIGKIVNRDPKSVWNWLKDFDIPTRGRGTDIRQQFIKGQINPFLGKKHTPEAKQKIREARLKDGRIPSMKDGVHWMKHRDYKVKNHPSWKGGCTPERQSFYASVEWVEAVKSVWDRDNATCQKCNKHHNTVKNRGTFHIHHIVSFMVKELRSNVDNLVLLCDECHRWVHSPKNKEKYFLGGNNGRS